MSTIQSKITRLMKKNTKILIHIGNDNQDIHHEMTQMLKLSDEDFKANSVHNCSFEHF